MQTKSRAIKIEVCPDKCIGINLHSHNIIAPAVWEDVSKKVRNAYQNRAICRCCGVTPHGGATGQMSQMVAHEVWEFDKENQIQKLIDIVCICARCHLTVHYVNHLISQNIDARENVISKGHYMEVNHCSEGQFENDLNAALALYRELNQIEGWKLDISFGIEKGYFLYTDVNLENLERVAPGSAVLLEKYRAQAKLSFNKLPKHYLVDYADGEHYLKQYVSCEICGKKTSVVYDYYDVQIKYPTQEMYIAAKRRICSLCRETIYFGPKKWFKKFRSTTKHYMELNECSYQYFREFAKCAKQAQKNQSAHLFIYLKVPYIEDINQYSQTKRYLIQNGARRDRAKRWYLYPSKSFHLRDFRPFL